MPRFQPPPDWPRPQDDVSPAATVQASWPVRHKVLTSLGLLALLLLLVATRIDAPDGLQTADAGAPSPAASPVAADPSVAPWPESAPRPPDRAAVRAHTQARADARARADAEAGIEPAVMAHLGDPVVDHQFEFTVTGIECGVRRIGGRWLNVVAEGQFCLVNLDVENVGHHRRAFYGDHQVLVDTAGKRYSPSADAANYLDDSRSLYEQIGPGEQLAARVVYDMPKRSRPDRMDLHTSLFSLGVTVVLSRADG